jgi:arylsulfatase A-like enzyme
MPRTAALLIVAMAAASAGCSNPTPGTAAPRADARPSILLVTLDTTRADAIGPEAQGIETPSFDALAARGRRFRQAYATVPETLPSHTSIMTGLYPAGHGIHENARYLDKRHPVLAERLKSAGYRTAGFVSAFVLSRRFGLTRGFDVFDDEPQQGANERSAADTTGRGRNARNVRSGGRPERIEESRRGSQSPAGHAQGARRLSGAFGQRRPHARHPR